MEEVLLGLVGGLEHQALLGERLLAPGLDAEQTFQGMDPGAGEAPVLVALPFELRFMASAMRQPCAKPN